MRKNKKNLNTSEILCTKKSRSDVRGRVAVFIFSSFSIVALIFIACFVIAQGYPAVKNIGFFSIFFKADFAPSKNHFGVWGPLTITVISAGLATIIGLYISIRVAFFIFYRLKKGKRVVRFIVEMLATIPSVIFGIFASSSLGKLMEFLTGANSPNTIATAVVMLTFMIIPTMTSLILNQLKHVDKLMLKSSLGLGNTKTYSIYHVIKRTIRPGILVAAMTALGRAIGETMALAILLSGATANPFSGGFVNFFNASWNTLGGNIAYWMTSDAAGSLYLKNGLYAAGIMLFVLVIFINLFVMNASKKKKYHEVEYKFKFSYQTKSQFEAIFLWIIFIIKYPFMLMKYAFVYVSGMISKAWDFLTYHTIVVTKPMFYVSDKNEKHSIQKYSYIQAKSKRTKWVDWLRTGVEALFTTMVVATIAWIIMVVFIGGAGYFAWGHLFSTQKDSLGNSLLVTLLLIALTLIIAFPFSFFGALYLSEYAKKNSRFSRMVRFFLDSLGGTPSIIFGMFGLSFFLQTLHIALPGYWKVGSVLAGALTMSIVVLPAFTRIMEQSFSSVPQSMREGSYALGATKWETIKKIVIPSAMQGIVSAIILSVGRIVSETAPVYLTVGLMPHSTGILLPGQTLTARILYNAIYSSDTSSVARGKAFEAAIATFILVFALALLATFWEDIRDWIKRGISYCKTYLNRKERKQYV